MQTGKDLSDFTSDVTRNSEFMEEFRDRAEEDRFATSLDLTEKLYATGGGFSFEGWQEKFDRFVDGRIESARTRYIDEIVAEIPLSKRMNAGLKDIYFFNSKGKTGFKECVLYALFNIVQPLKIVALVAHAQVFSKEADDNYGYYTEEGVFFAPKKRWAPTVAAMAAAGVLGPVAALTAFGDAETATFLAGYFLTGVTMDAGIARINDVYRFKAEVDFNNQFESTIRGWYDEIRSEAETIYLKELDGMPSVTSPFDRKLIPSAT